MVRFKKRYFVVQFDREKDIISGRNQSIPKALQDPRPLDIPDGVLAQAIKDIVENIHGDFGRASVTTGLRTIYCNKETRLAMIQCRHGPHRLVGSSLPFLTKIKEEKVVPRLLYTGATIKNCNRRMEKYQREQLEMALNELQKASDEEKKEAEERLLELRVLHPSFN